MNVRRGLLALALLALASVGCGQILGPLLSPGAPTPAEAVRRTVAASPEVAATLRVLGTRETAAGVVVLYTVRQPANGERPAMEMLHYSLVERRWGGWRPTSGGGFGSSEPTPPENLVEYGTSRGDFTIVFGRVLSPDVAAVETRLDNDQALRDDTTGEVFALLAPAGSTPCELRVLGADGRVLRRFDLAPPPAPGKAGAPPNQCGNGPTGGTLPDNG